MTLKFSKGSLASAVKSLPAETREASGELNILTVSIMISSRSVFLVEYIWGFLRPAESSFYCSCQATYDSVRTPSLLGHSAKIKVE